MIPALFGARSRESLQKVREDEEYRTACSKLVAAGYRFSPASSLGKSPSQRSVATPVRAPSQKSAASLENVPEEPVSPSSHKPSYFGRRKPKSSTTYIAMREKIGPVCISLKSLESEKDTMLAYVRTKYGFNVHTFIEEKIEEYPAAVAALREYLRLPYVLCGLREDKVLAAPHGTAQEMDLIDAMGVEIVNSAHAVKKRDLDNALLELDALRMRKLDHVVIDIILAQRDATASLLNSYDGQNGFKVPLTLGVKADELVKPMDDSRTFRDLGLIFQKMKSGPPRSSSNVEIKTQAAVIDKSKVTQAIYEIFEVEKSNLKRLKVLETHYNEPVWKNWQEADFASPSFARSGCPTVRRIIEQSEKLLQELGSPSVSVERFCTVFIDKARESGDFYLAYRDYIDQFDYAHQCLPKSPIFHAFMEKLRQDPTTSFDTLRALPVQRLPRYVMALHTIMLNTLTSDPTFPLAMEAHRAMDEATRRIDERRRQYEDFKLLTEVDHKLNLGGAISSAQVKYKCELHVEEINDKKIRLHKRIFLLFSNLLLVLERKEQQTNNLARKGAREKTSERPPYIIEAMHPVASITAVDQHDKEFKLICLTNGPHQRRVASYEAESKEAKEFFLRALRDIEVRAKLEANKLKNEPYADRFDDLDVYYNIMNASELNKKLLGSVGVVVLGDHQLFADILSRSKDSYYAMGFLETKDMEARLTFAVHEKALNAHGDPLNPQNVPTWNDPASVQQKLLSQASKIASFLSHEGPDPDRFKTIMEPALRDVCEIYYKVRRPSLMHSRSFSSTSSLLSWASRSSVSSMASVTSITSEKNANLTRRPSTVMRRITNAMRRPGPDASGDIPYRAGTPEPGGTYSGRSPERRSRIPVIPGAARPFGPDRTSPQKNVPPLPRGNFQRLFLRGKSVAPSPNEKLVPIRVLEVLLNSVEERGLNCKTLYRGGDTHDINKIVEDLVLKKPRAEALSRHIEKIPPERLAQITKGYIATANNGNLLWPKETLAEIRGSARMQHRSHIDEDFIEAIKFPIRNLPLTNQRALAMVFLHWQGISRQAHTQLDARKLAGVLAQTVMREETGWAIAATECIIANADKLFDNIEGHVPVRPITPRRSESMVFDKPEHSTTQPDSLQPSDHESDVAQPQHIELPTNVTDQEADQAVAVSAPGSVSHLFETSTPSSDLQVQSTEANFENVHPIVPEQHMHHDQSERSESQAPIEQEDGEIVESVAPREDSDHNISPEISAEIVPQQPEHSIPELNMGQPVPKDVDDLTAAHEEQDRVHPSETEPEHDENEIPADKVMLSPAAQATEETPSSPASLVDLKGSTGLLKQLNETTDSSSTLVVRRCASLQEGDFAESLYLSRIELANKSLRLAKTTLESKKSVLEKELSDLGEIPALVTAEVHEGAGENLDTEQLLVHLPELSAVVDVERLRPDSIADEFKLEMAAFVKGGSSMTIASQKSDEDSHTEQSTNTDHLLKPNDSVKGIVSSRSAPYLSLNPLPLKATGSPMIAALIEENKKLQQENLKCIREVSRLEQQKSALRIGLQSNAEDIALPAES
ncbi:uncharacterized protein SPPG_02108 [Spizellomyces punctatus DAOM BR117]|uniref:DH domain-containing protein n=1 Tax=Spizellomyces punctatus (strain DAOM BR117) TaxID=645134 RepID=A0A0L0HQF6_SPIPD|nr:uncharacterized protein SPPG_02108 [Spizellomyces punctatus DAOM BR117]KND03039.1 hypothetical protein SPPG_02108 [Spizellomyces punctatus DAOM BR117]|eukprot:XP_016611078.1 hypothetical protein SPPG_02108 [Spizellomyces punctatus DAOM BR117]